MNFFRKVFQQLREPKGTYDMKRQVLMTFDVFPISKGKKFFLTTTIPGRTVSRNVPRKAARDSQTPISKSLARDNHTNEEVRLWPILEPEHQ